jgi:transforming growth factor-beta-induced protein
LTACATTQPSQQTIAEIAQGNTDFSILVEALVAAELVGLFDEPTDGPYTVFAPTNDAFAALLVELGIDKAALLANVDLLTSVLKYHVVPGAIMAQDVVDLISEGEGSAVVETALVGSSLTFTVGVDGVIINDTVNVIDTDIIASNGVIHVIDAVLLPPSD